MSGNKINWKALFVGAGIAVALTAVAFAATGTVAAGAAASMSGVFGQGGVYAIAAATGAALGTMITEGKHRLQDAGTTLISR